MRIPPHHHPCSQCGAKTECCGDVQQDYDADKHGDYSIWICAEYQVVTRGKVVLRGGFVCEGCESIEQDALMEASR